MNQLQIRELLKIMELTKNKKYNDFRNNLIEKQNKETEKKIKKNTKLLNTINKFNNLYKQKEKINNERDKLKNEIVKELKKLNLDTYIYDTISKDFYKSNIVNKGTEDLNQYRLKLENKENEIRRRVIFKDAEELEKLLKELENI